MYFWVLFDFFFVLLVKTYTSGKVFCFCLLLGMRTAVLCFWGCSSYSHFETPSQLRIPNTNNHNSPLSVKSQFDEGTQCI